MTFNEFLRWVVDNKEYVPLYSALIATIALLSSILSAIISTVISIMTVRKDRKIADERYGEQRKQYEEKLLEERHRREYDKHHMEERIRISEQPYFVFKDVKIIQNSSCERIIISTEFLNKGRGSAYNIIPDTECRATTFDMKEIQLHRQTNVQDHIAMVGETFVANWNYICGDDNRLMIYPVIKFSDASGRIYKQTYHIDVVDSKGNANVISWGSPELLK